MNDSDVPAWHATTTGHWLRLHTGPRRRQVPGRHPPRASTARPRPLHPRKPVRLTTVPVPALWGRAWLLAARPTVSTARHDANCSVRALALIPGLPTAVNQRQRGRRARQVPNRSSAFASVACCGCPRSRECAWSRGRPCMIPCLLPMNCPCALPHTVIAQHTTDLPLY